MRESYSQTAPMCAPSRSGRKNLLMSTANLSSSTPSDKSDLAATVHAEAIIIDGHCDILMPVADGKMRLRDRVEVPPAEGWEPPPGWRMSAEAALYDFSPHTDYFQTMGQYDIPRFLGGGLTSQACAIYIEERELSRGLERG